MAWIGSGKRNLSVGVIGLGYVGLPLALQICRNGHSVLGLDIDVEKTTAINDGRSYIKHIPAEEIQAARASKALEASTDFSRVDKLDAVVICVPTPLTRNREPDIQYITNTAKQIGPFVQPGQLIVLESTTYPGTTDTDLAPILEQLSHLKAGVDFHVAFSPEREDPGNPKYKTADIPKVVGGLTAECGTFAAQLYGRIGLSVVPVSSARAAEATKLLENIFRAVNIAMVNELKVVFQKMGIDIWEVVNAAKTKPFGYMPFYPGPGLGGHCIPIDPFYLTWKAREYGVTTRFIELAGEINTSMPGYVVARLLEALSDRGKALKNAKVLLVGLAYKKDVDDVRESPAFTLWELLEERGAKVSYADPHVAAVPRTREHAKYAGIKAVPITQAALEGFDAAVIVTDHTGVNYELIVRQAALTVDTRNACGKLPEWLRAERVIKA